MIWFNLKKLEKRISANSLTDNEGYKYFLASALLIGVLDLLNRNMGLNYLIIINAIIALAFTIVNIVILYELNSSMDDKDFLLRYIAVMWMVRLRALLCYLILLALYLLYFRLHGYSVHTLAYQLGITLFICIYTLMTSFYSFKRLKPLLQPVGIEIADKK